MFTQNLCNIILKTKVCNIESSFTRPNSRCAKNECEVSQIKRDHVKYYLFHGSYELTYSNQRIRRVSWFK